jgi:hypothetical protein
MAGKAMRLAGAKDAGGHETSGSGGAASGTRR